MDEEATSKKRKKSRRGRRTTKRKKEMHPEIKESLKLSDKGSYYKQEDFYSSTDESNEDTNSNSEQVPSASSTKAFLWSSKLNSDDDSVFCWELLAYFFPLLDDFIFNFFLII